MGKGSDFERDICKYLSKWYQGSVKPYIWWRGRGSGSVFTMDSEAGESFAGDIYSIRNEGRWLTDKVVIECKNGYPRASIDKHLKDNKNDQLLDFWAQVDNDATKTGKYPILIYRKKGQSPWVGINNGFSVLFHKYLTDLKYIHLHWTVNIDDIYFFDMNKFFENITPDIMKGTLK